jgi:hypothetical protein
MMGIDPHDEQQFSAVHFDLHLVMELIQHTIAQRRTNQRFILLEGLCNSGKLDQNDDKLSLRYMDELFLIEKQLGEVTAVVSLTFNKEENTHGEEKSTKYEEFAVSEKAEEAKKVLGDGSDGEENEADGAAAEGDGEEGAKPKFNPKDFQWTVTNGFPKNLLTIFSHVKNINALPDLREASSYSEKSTNEAVTNGLDDFCGRVVEETSSRNLYLQVLFAGQ